MNALDHARDVLAHPHEAVSPTQYRQIIRELVAYIEGRKVVPIRPNEPEAA